MKKKLIELKKYILKKDYKEWIWIAGLFAVFFAYTLFILLQSPNNPYSKIVENTDSSVFQYIGRGILDGMIPYRDAFDHKGPILYLINALGLLIADREGVWLLEVVMLFATMVVSYKLCRVYFTKAASVVAVLVTYALLALYLKGGNFTEEYAMLPCVIALYIFANYFKYKTVSNAQLTILGATCMIVLLLKVNLAGIWAIYCCYFFFATIFKKEWKELFRYILFFLLGAAIVLLPIAIWLAVNGAWNDFTVAYLDFNMAYTEDKGEVETFNMFMEMLNASKFFLNEQTQLQFLIGALAPAVIFVKEKDKSKALFILLNSIYLIACLVFIVMPGRNYTHYGLYYIPAMVLVYGVLFHYLERWLRNNQEILTCVAAVLIIFSVKIFFVENMLVQIDEIAVTREYSSQNAQIVEIVDKLTEPEDEILVIGSKCWIYNHTNHKAANRYIFQWPVVTISDELSEDFQKVFAENPPALLMTQDRSLGMDEPKMREEQGYVLRETYEGWYFYTLE